MLSKDDYIAQLAVDVIAIILAAMSLIRAWWFIDAKHLNLQIVISTAVALALSITATITIASDTDVRWPIILCHFLDACIWGCLGFLWIRHAINVGIEGTKIITIATATIGGIKAILWLIMFLEAAIIRWRGFIDRCDRDYLALRQGRPW